MVSKWKIEIEGLENYRFGEDGNLYKLPFVTKDKKHRGLKLVAKDKLKKRWFLTRFGKLERWSENQLRAHLVKDTENLELTKEIDLPF